MFDFIYAEILKIKKSKVVLCLILTSIILPAIWFFLSLFHYPYSAWASASIEVEDFTFLIVETLIFVLLSNYVFVKEYSYDTKGIEYVQNIISYFYCYNFNTCFFHNVYNHKDKLH